MRLGYEIPFFLLSIGVYFLYVFFQKKKEAEFTVRAFFDENKAIVTWPTVKGVIVKKGYNIDYCFEHIIAHSKSDSRIKPAENPFYDEGESNIANKLSDINRKILLEYEYSVNGETFVSRSISPVLDGSEVSILKKAKVGDSVAVFVNPQNSAQSFLKKCTPKAIDEVSNKIKNENLTFLIYSMISFSLAGAYFL